MAKKDTYVRFQPKGGARIGVNHIPKGEGQVLKNPDLSLVKGISPSLWSLDAAGRVIPSLSTEKPPLIGIIKHRLNSRLIWFLVGAAATEVLHWLM